MNLKPEVVEQLQRVLSSVEQLLQKAIEPIDRRETSAANWRQSSGRTKRASAVVVPHYSSRGTGLDSTCWITRTEEAGASLKGCTILPRRVVSFCPGLPYEARIAAVPRPMRPA